MISKIHESNNIAKDSVRVLLRKSKTTMLPFGGFVEASSLVNIQFVKILDVVGFNAGDDKYRDWHEFENSYVVGVFLDDKIYVALFDGMVRHYPFCESVTLSRIVRSNVYRMDDFR